MEILTLTQEQELGLTSFAEIFDFVQNVLTEYDGYPCFRKCLFTRHFIECQSARYRTTARIAKGFFFKYLLQLAVFAELAVQHGKEYIDIAVIEYFETVGRDVRAYHIKPCFFQCLENAEI